jgi:predicted oxidoreductase
MWALIQFCLAWILQHPAKVIPVAGTVNVARIQSINESR